MAELTNDEISVKVAEVADSMMGFLALTAPIRDAVNGYYRTLAEVDGFPEAEARSMAAAFHNMLLRTIARGDAG